MAPLRRLLLAGGLAASLFIGCAVSEEPSRVHIPKTGVITYSDYESGPNDNYKVVDETNKPQEDSKTVPFFPENKGDNRCSNILNVHLAEDSKGLEIKERPKLEKKIPVINRCYARKGDEFVDYSTLSVDLKCDYDYIRMDLNERFVLVCKADCPLPQDYLDRKFVAIENTFDNLESFLGVSTPDSIKPIEIHITSDDVCHSDSNVTSSLIEREGVWRGRICYPTFEKNNGDISGLLETVDNPDSMIGHEASHLILGDLYDMPYLWSEWQSRIAEAASKGETEDMCDSFLNRRAFMTDNQVHGVADWSHQIEYDLCQLGFNADDSSIVLSRINAKREQLGIEGRLLPFNLAVREFDRFLTEKQERPISVVPLLIEAGLEDALIPFLDQRGVSDIVVEDIKYRPQENTISANICNLGSLVTDSFNVDLRIGNQSRRLVQMGIRYPYECFNTMQIDLESNFGIPAGTMIDINTQVVADVDNRVIEINEDNNILERDLKLGQIPLQNLYVNSIFSSLFSVPAPQRYHKAIYAEVCREDLDERVLPFEYRFLVNGQNVKEGTVTPNGWSCNYATLYYPDETNGIDQGETPEITFEIDPNGILEDRDRSDNTLTVSYELPDRGER